MGLLPIERLILEDLDLGPKSLEELENSTGLGKKILKAILNSFLNLGIIQQNEEIFFINKLGLHEYLREFNSKDNIKEELKDLTQSYLGSYFEGSKEVNLNILKVFLDKYEKEALEYHLEQVTDFLKSVLEKKKGQNQGHIKDKTVFFCGYGPYRLGLNS